MIETPQNNPHHCCSVGEHTLKAIEAVPADKVLRLTMLLHDIAKPACRTTDKKGVDHFYGHPVRGSEMARGILRRLKFDNDTTDRVCGWCTGTMIIRSFPGRRFAGRCTGLAWNSIRHCLRSSSADILAQSGYRRAEKLAYVDAYEQMYRECMEKKECLTIRELAVSGSGSDCSRNAAGKADRGDAE